LLIKLRILRNGFVILKNITKFMKILYIENFTMHSLIAHRLMWLGARVWRPGKRLIDAFAG